MSIMQDTRIPDGVILCYPALYMSFVPSPARYEIHIVINH